MTTPYISTPWTPAGPTEPTTGTQPQRSLMETPLPTSVTSGPTMTASTVTATASATRPTRLQGDLI